MWRTISRTTHRAFLEPASDADPVSEDSAASSGPEELEELAEPEEPEPCLSEASPEPEACPEASSPPLPHYSPPVSVEDRPGRPQNVPSRSTPLQLFQLFFTTEVIAVLVEQSNPRARARGFNPLTVGAFYRYLGCLVYMGIYKYPEIRDYWKRNVIGTRLGLSRDRLKEIQVIFTFRNPDILPMPPSDPWWFRLEPLASSIRDSCQRYWILGAKLAVDEGMIPYHGHTPYPPFY